MAFILLKKLIVNVNQKCVVPKSTYGTIKDFKSNYFDFSGRTKRLQVVSVV